MADPLAQLLEETVRRHVEPSTILAGYHPLPTPERDRPYGDAAVQRYAVEFRDRAGRDSTATLLVKDAPLIERRVLELLSVQRQPGVPYAHALDLASDALAPVCQEDVAPDPGPKPADLAQRAAERLAAIHAANLGRGDELGWLPRADRAYFGGSFVVANWREQWDESMRLPEFAREWGPERPRLEEAATLFLADMDLLWAEGDSLTLVHADLHGDHVLVHSGEPYIIDWGQARYGSLYLDLPNYFPIGEVGAYREALAALGRPVPEDVFIERYRMASRYVAFKYMGYTLWASRDGGDPLLRGQWNLFDLALNGARL